MHSAGDAGDSADRKRSRTDEPCTALLSDMFDEILQENNPNARQRTSSTTQQLDGYLSEVPIPRSNNPLEYWRTNQGRFPDLAQMARRSMSVGGATFPLEQKSKDPQAVVYSAMYDTEGVAHTKSGERQPVQVSIHFMVAGLFETMWQVKFYNYNKRDHCQWGNSFRSIEYECKPNDTHSLMWISKETFL
ncbi:CB1 cannabinoid receptor-interacting protein 1b isoform X1 [Ictalurus furcatus]|uniref:CB1 cannabinoid receptor-interacting protein 1b isoform X1 n=1 Tax=Ictalurus furcatus TaxID=66913 RepID=UPI00234FD8FA|nr:CB1 cannabinoid receptor-interacting protein 1b isoform X1 [Ictalurus furcatus]